MDTWSKDYNDDVLVAPEDSKLNELEGGVTHGECLRLAYLASKVDTNVNIVEIGSYRGKSTCFLGMGSKYGNQSKVYAIDPWDLNMPYPEATRPYWDRANKVIFDRNIRMFGLENIVVGIKNFSLDEAKKWTKRIGLLHIDGDHSYVGVSSDFKAWHPHLVSGGTIAFHDYNLDTVREFVSQTINSNLYYNWVVYNRLITATKR